MPDMGFATCDTLNPSMINTDLDTWK